MKKLLAVILLSICTLSYVQGQTNIIVKDNLTGKIRKLKKGKIVGIITNTNDTIQYGGSNSRFWCLKSFTDTSLTIEIEKTGETKTMNLNQVKSISYVRNERDGSPVAMTVAGAALIIASPFIGIKKEGYDFEQAAISLGIGTGLLAIVYLTTRHKDLRYYSIVGVKNK